MTLLFFLIGVSLGSFLTVLIPRLFTGEKGIFWGRSRCDHTGKTLTITQLIPIFSYFSAAQKPAAWYPVAELTSGLLWVLAFQHTNDPYQAAFLGIILTGLWALFLFDALHGLVDRRISIAVMVLLSIYILLFFPLSFLPWVGAFAGGSWFFLQWRLSNGQWCGQGDIDLGIILGLCTSISGILLGLFGAYILGTLWILCLYLTRKTRPKTLPMGPFLMTAAAAFLLWGDSIISFYLTFSGL